MIRHVSVRLPLTFAKVRPETLRVVVLCDSVLGLEVEQRLEMMVTGDEEQTKGKTTEAAVVEEDEALDAAEFADDDVVYDEYLVDWSVCCKQTRY